MPEHYWFLVKRSVWSVTCLCTFWTQLIVQHESKSVLSLLTYRAASNPQWAGHKWSVFSLPGSVLAGDYRYNKQWSWCVGISFWYILHSLSHEELPHPESGLRGNQTIQALWPMDGRHSMMSRSFLLNISGRNILVSIDREGSCVLQSKVSCPRLGTRALIPRLNLMPLLWR